MAAELKSLPCGMIGPGTLHRVIAAAQKTILASGMLAVGPSPKHCGKVNAIAARAPHSLCRVYERIDRRRPRKPGI